MGHPGSRWVLDADAQLLDVGHGIVVNVGVTDVVVALAQFLLAGDPDLDVPKVLAHLHRLFSGFQLDLRGVEGKGLDVRENGGQSLKRSFLNAVTPGRTGDS